MLFKRIYVLNDIKILWFANSYAFEKDVLDKWYENTLICKFIMLFKRMYGVNDRKILWFAISYAFQKDVW